VLNVFRYISFRSAYAAITALILCYVLGPPMIEWLREVKLGQKIRREGPQSHLAKAGTPTMGGLLIVTAIVVPSLLWCNLHSRPLWLALLSTVWLGGIGFLDDWLRVVKGLPNGLLGRYKLAGQITLGAVIGLILVIWPEKGLPATTTHVPFLKYHFIDFSWLFVPFVILVITGASNAVNLTDGLDGLAIGPVMITAGTYAVFAFVTGNAKLADYLQIPFVGGAGELAVFCSALAAAGLGFLWFNAYPAQMFMGDVGSLPLGAALAMVALITKHELVLVVVGAIFVVEALSVIAQVAYFKWTGGKRIFRMAPIHHHYELQGWPEPLIIVRFWIISVICALLALSTLKLR